MSIIHRKAREHAIINIVSPAVAGAVLSLLFAACSSPSATEQLTSQFTPSSAVALADAAAKKYKDGTYSAIGTYAAPPGPENITVSLTLKDDVIADATAQATSKNERSKMFQQRFLDGFKEQVVGKPVDQLQLTVVNGSSLTPKGFMDAVQKIETQAKQA